MKKLVLLFILTFLTLSCTKEVVKYYPVYSKVPFPEKDKKNYEKSREVFFKYQEALLKNKDYLKLFKKLSVYFMRLSKVQKYKTIYMKNMEVSIKEHNKMKEKEKKEIKKNKDEIEILIR